MGDVWANGLEIHPKWGDLCSSGPEHPQARITEAEHRHSLRVPAGCRLMRCCRAATRLVADRQAGPSGTSTTGALPCAAGDQRPGVGWSPFGERRTCPAACETASLPERTMTTATRVTT